VIDWAGTNTIGPPKKSAGEDLRAALKEVEKQERLEREQRQKELEESLKRGA
jgi:hypothetical protein